MLSKFFTAELPSQPTKESRKFRKVNSTLLFPLGHGEREPSLARALRNERERPLLSQSLGPHLSLTSSLI